MARQYDVGAADPNIQVVGAALKGDRTLFLELRMHSGVPLHHAAKELVATTSSNYGVTKSPSQKRLIDARASRKILLLNSRHGPAGDSSMIV